MYLTSCKQLATGECNGRGQFLNSAFLGQVPDDWFRFHFLLIA